MPSRSRTRPLTPAERYLPAALRYAAAGLPVFLLGRTKRPVTNCRACPKDAPGHEPDACGCLCCHGFYAATTDPDRIRAMTEVIPNGLLAIRTGAASRLLVADIDPAHGGYVDPELMSPTATVASGGGGWHLHYRHPGQPVASRPLPGRPGVDIKADGGYVVAPPSIHPATRRPYQWIGSRPRIEMPPRLLAACLAPTRPAARPATGPRPPATSPPATPGGGGISSPAALLAAHINAVDQAAPGRRRVTLYGATRGVARMVAAGAITAEHAWTELAAAGRRAEQTERDIHAAITGGFAAEGVPAYEHP